MRFLGWSATSWLKSLVAISRHCKHCFPHKKYIFPYLVNNVEDKYAWNHNYCQKKEGALRNFHPALNVHF